MHVAVACCLVPLAVFRMTLLASILEVTVAGLKDTKPTLFQPEWSEIHQHPVHYVA